ncbi:MAG: phosphosulfolactate synthase [Bacteroidales bacterium]|nr:phosphosulfolactate synthase [Bacteroidales bacterium]
MNFSLPFIPERTLKPRREGLNMIMDKGLGIYEAQNLIDSAGHLIDFVKLGFGTSYITKNLEQKIVLYKNAGIKVYFGGTLFEAFYIRNMVDDYLKLIEKFGLEVMEISDGEVIIPHQEKCEMIARFSKYAFVLSEVGSKEAGVVIPNNQWVNMMNLEMEAGSKYVIAEAREAGNIGIYNKDGSANTSLIDAIKKSVNTAKILWEAPHKPQQVFFVKEFGANVNLGNIAHNEVIALETVRLGLRGDTFFNWLPDELKAKQQH